LWAAWASAFAAVASAVTSGITALQQQKRDNEAVRPLLILERWNLVDRTDDVAELAIRGLRNSGGGPAFELTAKLRHMLPPWDESDSEYSIPGLTTFVPPGGQPCAVDWRAQFRWRHTGPLPARLGRISHLVLKLSYLDQRGNRYSTEWWISARDMVPAIASDSSRLELSRGPTTMESWMKFNLKTRFKQWKDKLMDLAEIPRSYPE